MINDQNPQFVDSVLETKAEASLNDQIQKDLELPEGKSIAELLDDEEKNKQE